ncbi:10914_t:CDS:2, partial [Gigaspora rosea]
QSELRIFFNSNQQKFSITTDAWSSCTNLGFLALTLHWIDESWFMKRILLNMIPLHEQHTGNYITEKILETISFYNIGSRIISATTDNAASMNVFGHMLREKLRYNNGNKEFEHVRCAAHVLNLAVTEGMKVVVDSITKLRSFVSYIRKSQPLFEDLKRIFQDNPSLKDRYLDQAEWNEIEIVVILLEPITKATPILSASSSPTMGDLHMIFPIILSILRDVLYSEILIKNQIAQRIHKKLDDYWNILQTCCH